MPSFFENSMDWFTAQQKLLAGREVIYKRGVNEITITIVDGASEFEHDDGSGTLDKFETRDYIVAAADLVINDVTILPQRGDQIIDGSETVTVDMPDGMSVFQDDALNRRWVIHTWIRDADA